MYECDTSGRKGGRIKYVYKSSYHTDLIHPLLPTHTLDTPTHPAQHRPAAPSPRRTVHGAPGRRGGPAQALRRLVVAGAPEGPPPEAGGRGGGHRNRRGRRRRPRPPGGGRDRRRKRWRLVHVGRQARPDGAGGRPPGRRRGGRGRGRRPLLLLLPPRADPGGQGAQGPRGAGGGCPQAGSGPEGAAGGGWYC